MSPRPFPLRPKSTEPRARSTESWHYPLRHHNYRIFVTLSLVGSGGVWMQRLAQDWLVLQLTGSPAAVGVAVALQFLPMLVVGPISGVLVDLFPKRRILLVCQSVAVLLAAGLAVWNAMGGTDVWIVYASCIALGITSAIDGPARQVFVNEVVGDAGLPAAIGLNSAIGQLGAMAGPALAGVVIAQAGPAAAFGANALIGVSVLVMIASIRPGELHHSPEGPEPGARRGQILAGFRFVRARPPLLLTMLLAGLLGAFGMNGPVVLAAFADGVWHSGPAGFGLFNTVSALGALAGALVATRIKRFGRKGIVASAGLFGLTQGLAALMPTQEWFVVMLIVVGFMTLVFLTSAATAVQLEAGASVRGRVLALYFPLLLGGHALGGLLAGWLTEDFGVRTGLVVTGALGMLSAAVIGFLLWRYSARRRT
ncbi:MFS transporter [Arthrobacter sp. MYb23]|uniref:MFS transporter n=1 Tax=unclassified Arthrobacter TaxID=235627 RepID=UPI000CFCE989|nr:MULTISPECIES: MFS transporter [unclassified Arthrobacter]PRB44896.1 MFS transporter [Arthrobacter sp. MYb51]PRB99641.1 MFS transporter [Arthrobacter sp. MYb23]